MSKWSLRPDESELISVFAHRRSRLALMERIAPRPYMVLCGGGACVADGMRCSVGGFASAGGGADKELWRDQALSVTTPCGQGLCHARRSLLLVRLVPCASFLQGDVVIIELLGENTDRERVRCRECGKTESTSLGDSADDFHDSTNSRLGLLSDLSHDLILDSLKYF